MKKIISFILLMMVMIINVNAYYTWSNKTSVLPGYNLGDNAYFSSNGEIAVVTMYNADGYIIMSHDGGNTWSTKLYVPDDWFYFVPISADGQKVFTIGYNNNLLYLSTDSGNTWTNTTAIGLGNICYSLAMSADGTRMAAGCGNVGGNIFISTDDGTNWFNPNYDNPVSNFGNVFTIAMSTDGNKVVFSESGGYVYISTDGGHNFTSVTSLGQKSWYSVSMSPDGNKLCADNNADIEDAVYYSYDGGTTWNNHTGHHLYECAIAGNTIITTQAEDGNFLFSTDAGATWSAEDLNTTGSWFYGVGITPDATKVIAMASFTDLWLGELVPCTPNWQCVRCEKTICTQAIDNNSCGQLYNNSLTCQVSGGSSGGSGGEILTEKNIPISVPQKNIFQQIWDWILKLLGGK